MNRTLHYVLASVVFFFAEPILAQQPETGLAGIFVKTEVMIPMRDGVKLHTVIHSPRSSREPLPFILSRIGIITSVLTKSRAWPVSGCCARIGSAKKKTTLART